MPIQYINIPSSDGGGGGGGTPGGDPGDVQFNNAGSFGGDSGFTYDGAGGVNLSGDLSAVNVNASSLIKIDNTVSISTAGGVMSLNDVSRTFLEGGATGYGLAVTIGSGYALIVPDALFIGTTGDRTAPPGYANLHYDGTHFLQDPSNVIPFYAPPYTGQVVLLGDGLGNILEAAGLTYSANTLSGNTFVGSIFTGGTFNGIHTGDGSGLTNLPNLFDQTLNTTDSVQFAGVNITNQLFFNGDNGVTGQVVESYDSGDPAWTHILHGASGTASLNFTERLLVNLAGTTNIIAWNPDTTNTNSAAYWFDSANSNRMVGDGTGLTGIHGDYIVVSNNSYAVNSTVPTPGAGAYNIFLGLAAGAPLSGGSANYNVAIGAYAGANITTGSENFFGGHYAGTGTMAGAKNVGIGYNAIGSNASGDANVGIGFGAGISLNGGSGNILIGQDTAANLSAGSRNIVIGDSINIIPGGGTLDNQLTIGNLIYGTDVDGTGNTISSGNIGIGTYTPGYKLDVAGDVNATGDYHFDPAGLTAGYWSGSRPTTLAEALNRIAAVVSASGGTPIP